MKSGKREEGEEVALIDCKLTIPFPSLLPSQPWRSRKTLGHTFPASEGREGGGRKC